MCVLSEIISPRHARSLSPHPSPAPTPTPCPTHLKSSEDVAFFFAARLRAFSSCALMRFISSYSSRVMPISATLARRRACIATRVRSRISARVVSECFLPWFHGALPLLAAEILARLSGVCGRPG